MKTKHPSRHALALISSLIGLILLAGCAGDQSKSAANYKSEQQSVAPAQETQKDKKNLAKVKYAAFNGISGLAARYGVEKGFFAEEGLDIQIIDTQDPIPGLTSGDIDIADNSTTSAIVAAGKGAPLKIVSSMFRTKGPFYLIAKPGISRIEDLKGKKVGVGAFGSGLDAYTRVILKKHGLGKDDVTFIANGALNSAYASLEAGQVDATIIHEPFVSLAEKTGKGNLLAKGWDYLPTFHTGVLISSNKFIEKNPELVQKTIKAYFKSQEYAKSHKDEYLDYVAKNVKIDRDVLENAYKREDVLWENNPDIDINALNDTQKIQQDLGFQDKIYDVQKILDLRFIPKK